MGSTTAGHGESVTHSREYQYVLSQGHPYRNLGRGVDVGGPFLSQKVEIYGDFEPIWLDSGGWYRQYTALYPNSLIKSAVKGLAPTADYNAIAAKCSSICPPLIQDNTLDARGATAISRVKPTSPVFDGATAVAELISERKLFSIPGRNGSMSGEYLNYQLGVSPAIGAVTDFREAAERSEEIIAQLQRDSGKPIRRRFAYDQVRSATREDATFYPGTDPAALAYLVRQGKVSTFTTTTTDMWFSGAFTYFLPEEVGLRRKIRELDAVYGVKPGIDTAWELIPFSFVADYFANMGDVLSNVNAFASDGLVMKYGYMMAKQVKHVIVSWEGQVCINGTWVSRRLDATLVATTLQRRKANPFGFGVSDESLTPRQLSILAALGLNRR